MSAERNRPAPAKEPACASPDRRRSWTLTATAAGNSAFIGWVGADCTGTGTCVVTMSEARSVTATFDLLPGLYYTVTPCRIIDTRDANVPLANGVPRSIGVVSSTCGIPVTATAVSINVTAVGPTAGGHVVVYPGNGAIPETSTINFNAGLTRANNAVVPLATNSAGTLAARSK